MRIGGKGCPACGSHKTNPVLKGREIICRTCGHDWEPCSLECRGYAFDLRDPEGPCVIGCKECGTPDAIARTWPEAHIALGKEVFKNVDKLDATLEQFPIKRDRTWPKPLTKTVGR